jgi:hypothetical protein
MRELELIFETGMRAYPPRLPDQPIFYPVLNESYATQIAREWNTKSAPYAGYVTRFQLDDVFGRKYEVHVVGGSEHQELWVPAEQLNDFNAHIRGPIEVTAGYFGAEFEGHVPSKFGMRNMEAIKQIQALAATREYSMMDFHLETRANELTVFLNFPFWLTSRPSVLGLEAEVVADTLDRIRKCWDMGERIAPLVERGESAA